MEGYTADLERYYDAGLATTTPEGDLAIGFCQGEMRTVLYVRADNKLIPVESFSNSEWGANAFQRDRLVAKAIRARFGNERHLEDLTGEEAIEPFGAGLNSIKGTYLLQADLPVRD